MIDRDTWLAIAKESGIKFGEAQFSGVLEAEISEFDLEAYTRAVAQKSLEDEADKLKDAMDSFWTMLMACESTADNINDPVLKHWVEGWHQQYTRLTGREVKPPRWVGRNRGIGGVE